MKTEFPISPSSLCLNKLVSLFHRRKFFCVTFIPRDILTKLKQNWIYLKLVDDIFIDLIRLSI